jgi:V8-like Glu-specific endopeptidase
MKLILAILTLSLATHVFAEINVIYGFDNRRDIFEVSNTLHIKLAHSTAAMIPISAFAKSSKQTFFDLKNTPTLEKADNICPAQSFSQQPTAAMCSGFLVGPDTLVTAGHCFKTFSTPEQVCKSFAWVFGFEKSSASMDPTKDIALSNIYLCKKVVDAQLSALADYAVIKLDRPVTGREPLKYRTTGKISDSASLVVIGHPTGLPTKVSPGGKVTRNIEATRFSTTLDTFHGNSGSAVFDAKTGLVEGILIQGKNDYVPSKADDSNSCKVVNNCDENGNNCSGGLEQGPVEWGEVVLRIDQILKVIDQALALN